MPFCPGCGHTVVTQQLSRAMEKLEISPFDVIEVSDIGCCGLIDGVIGSHTVHGLHGRSPALAMGIRLGLENPDKKVIVVIGDGGATIGLQHLLEAARQNVDITVLLLDNMIYGMTGGQVSGLTPELLKERMLPEESTVPPFNMVELVHQAGAAYAARVYVGPEVQPRLEEALQIRGFSMVEILEMCPAHGLKKLKEVKEISGFPPVIRRNERISRQLHRHQSKSLFESLTNIPTKYTSNLKDKIGILIAGSAGEGVQSAGQILASAGISAGLQTTKKGEYPITVGTGFSVAEVILSPEPIHYTGIDEPQVVIIVSRDGWEKVKGRIAPHTLLIVDEQIDLPAGTTGVRGKFREKAGHKGAALAAVAFWVRQSDSFPVQALQDVISDHPRSEALKKAIQAGIDLGA